MMYVTSHYVVGHVSTPTIDSAHLFLQYKYKLWLIHNKILKKKMFYYVYKIQNILSQILFL